jgi:hypothetical protein
MATLDQVHPPGTVLKLNTHGELRAVGTLDLMEAIQVAQEGSTLLSLPDAERPAESGGPSGNDNAGTFRLSVQNKLGRMVYLQSETGSTGRNQVRLHPEEPKHSRRQRRLLCSTVHAAYAVSMGRTHWLSRAAPGRSRPTSHATTR